MGDNRLALDCFRESLLLHREVHDVVNIAFVLDGAAELADLNARFDLAVRLSSAAEGLRRHVQIVLPLADRAELDRRLLARWTTAGEIDFQRAWQAGEHLSPDQAISAGLATVEELETPVLARAAGPTLRA